MRKARPSWAASSSATTSISQAAARLMRATSMMPGSECGTITRRTVAHRPAPSVADALSSSRGTARATSATIRMLKNTVPTTISVIFGLSSIPSHSSNSGVSAWPGCSAGSRSAARRTPRPTRSCRWRCRSRRRSPPRSRSRSATRRIDADEVVARACRRATARPSASHVAAGDGTRNDVLAVERRRRARPSTANSATTPSDAERRSASAGRSCRGCAAAGAGAARGCGRGRRRPGGAPARRARPDRGADRRHRARRPPAASVRRRAQPPALVDVRRGVVGHEQVGQVGFLLGQAGLDEERVDPPGHLGQRRRVVRCGPRRQSSACSAVKIVVPSAKSSYSSGGHLGLGGHDRRGLLGVGLDPVERQVPGVDQLLQLGRRAPRRRRPVATRWSEMTPGKSAELNSTCEPWPLERLHA